ncbi:Alpha/Beta hydrolase protein [Mycotypha africana]|uniref:Alpha/Beta hydrolase protein n=1 Tax=Mycotypha africana TaxID=64632 RepID=UPI0022FFC84C|nr:Alpha/Beta hydrolase protein [Mycotypha africana]KAI8991649.1 Alpha/Beta hydrolase protein [Mycotypha africana]
MFLNHLKASVRKGTTCGPVLLQSRLFTAKSSAISLAYDKFSKGTSTASPLLICHGLFGSKQNWSSLGKALNGRLSRDIYTIDLRNHGDSLHTDEHNYELMSEDLYQFINEHELKKPVLLGHSMGGKAVMATALKYPDIISKLVVVDMPPVSMNLANNFASYCDAMREIEESNPSKQSEADKILSKYEADVGVRMFLLTNLKRIEENGGHKYRFRVPYETLRKSLKDVGGFDVPDGVKYDKPTLFIAGGKSPYRIPFLESREKIESIFPCSSIEIVEGAGHWVHAEKPEVVLRLVTDFLK